MTVLSHAFAALLIMAALSAANAAVDDPPRQLLVTFDNENAQYHGAGFQPPYRARKRYAIAASVRKHAKAIAAEYSLLEVEQWPLSSLSVYCFVFEVDSRNSEQVIAALSKDARVESVQWLNRFQTQAVKAVAYDDTFASMQHGLDTISLSPAHQYSQGEGVRVAVVDSDADHRHEDLKGSIKRTDHLAHAAYERDQHHGTAVASVIGANANNALGIVGVAPASSLEVSEACWRDAISGLAVCDTFSLAKALDAMFQEPPHVINLSLSGPKDALLQRILERLIERDVVVVAAAANTQSSSMVFPASMAGVISVATIGETENHTAATTVFAPGEKILVAVPSNEYEFKSGSSLATAHVSGIVALLKAYSPSLSVAEIREILLKSQSPLKTGRMAVNACRALAFAQAAVTCD